MPHQCVQRDIRLTKTKLGNTFLHMASEESRNRKTVAKRAFQGEDEARFLLGLMNDSRLVHRDTPKALQEIILALQGLQPITPITRQRAMSGDLTLNEQANRIEAVNRILRQYIAVPRIKSPSLMSGSGIRLEWRPTGDNATSRRQTRGDAHTELSAVLIAIGLAGEGRIHSLRQCRNCERWFFAKFKHSKFCVEDCKNTFHREDAAEKERRREWARNNYRSRKTLEAGSSKAANQPRVRNTGGKSK
jgi:hypothetical protein